MPKAVLISIQPYWVFLIIAKMMGWNIEKEKTVEVRKNYPKANDWDKTAKIYCSKDKKSFAKIPKEYQPLMQQFLGKVIGEFVCDNIDEFTPSSRGIQFRRFGALGDTCLSLKEITEYLNGQKGYGWHISDLGLYDKPKELSKFTKPIPEYSCLLPCDVLDCVKCHNEVEHLKRPPQSWCYVEGGKE